MVVAARVPPGRAGRLWLRRMLITVNRGREQLDRRLRVLIPELQWRRLEAARRQEEWTQAWTAAEEWLLRSEILTGREGILQAVPQGELEVTVHWTTAMGCTYPLEIAVASVPETDPAPAPNAALPEAVVAVRAALEAGLRAAAAEEAVRRIEDDIALTRRRLHGLENRWLPWLEESLRGVEQALEQAELDDAIRLRRAVDMR